MEACPICEHAACASLWTMTPNQVARAFLSEDADRQRFAGLEACIRRLWQGSDLTVRSCPSCLFDFADPFVSGDQLFYALSSPRDGYPVDRWEYGETEKVLDRLKLRGNILELGAGVGHFLHKIVPKHFETKAVTAFDYNPRGISALEAAGYNAFSGDFRESLPDSRRFQAIFMFHVLEHLDHPHETFEKISQLLEPEGRLFVSVPNPDRIEFNEKTGSLRDMPPAHVGRWRPETFERIAKAHGLEIVSIQRSAFSLREFIATDIGYYYLCKAQERGTLAFWSRSLRDRPYGTVLMRSMAAVYGPSRILTWLQHAARLTEYRMTLFAHFRKPTK